MAINKNIFREYDIRGLYPNEINQKTAYLIAQGFAKFLNLRHGDKIVVGYDKRPSSPKLAIAFILGLTDIGINVINVGKTTTPELYFSVPFLSGSGGAMITASHNLKKYNGIKFVRKNTEPISGLEIKSSVIQKIKKEKKKGTMKNFDINAEYKKEVFKDFSSKRKINHLYDYDADRLIVKDKKGNPIRGDIIGGIVGESTAKKGDTIIYDIRCSRAIPEYFRNKGIKTTPCKIGHFNIKKLMRQEKAVFGMEITGHYYFKKFNYAESPDFALRKIIEQMNKTSLNLHELTKPFLKYYHSDVINLKKNKYFEKNIQKFKDMYRNGSQNETDGLTIEFSNWWFNIRESKTESIIRLSIEANTEELLKEKQKELLDAFK